jgi:pimeloyl-ACP methyl ester carboxylesterase/DNA-binding CsgD family transcriptional regulator
VERLNRRLAPSFHARAGSFIVSSTIVIDHLCGDFSPAGGDHAAARTLLEAAWPKAPDEAADVLDETIAFSFATGSAALVAKEAVAIGVYGANGRLVHTAGCFGDLFPLDGAHPDLAELVKAARTRETAIKGLQTADGTVVASWAARAPAATNWRLDDAIRQALDGRDRVVVLVFAPSRSTTLAARAAEAFGLSPLEARLAQAVLSAPTLEIAAAQLGVGRETARDAMRGAAAKLGVRRTPDIVRRMLELMCAVHDPAPPDADAIAPALGLTISEARVALEIAGGRSQAEAADGLGLKTETVRGYVKSALNKTGLARAKDLGRLVAETQALSQLASVAEPVFTSDDPSVRLRVIAGTEGRRVAFSDYGPTSGRPVCLFHGFVAGRSLPPALVRGLQARGLRPLVPQRPGFGLTERARSDYLKTASNDLLCLMRALKLEDLVIFARDGGVAAALEFASRHPERVRAGVLLNPRPPGGLPASHRTPIATFVRLSLAKPHLIESLGDLLRRQTRTDLVEAQLRRALRAWPSDLAALDDPAIRRHLVLDIQAQFAHSSSGFVAEHSLHAAGWTVPPLTGAGSWLVLHSQGAGQEPPRRPWSSLPNVEFRTIPNAGVLAQFTHPQALIDALAS